MSQSPTLDDALRIALQLNPKERLRLIEQVASSVEQAMDDNPSDSTTHWGQNLLRLLDEAGPVELNYPEIEDPVEWVKHIRQEQAISRS